ncbi:MAG: ABC transporter substrate-binding protein [Chloroflexi bacterium]|nr:ABC transporter substrate-binding protein [Chloroflexota bacterium]
MKASGLRLIATVVGLLIIALACAPAAPQPKQVVKVTMGGIRGVSDAGDFIALEKGFFREQGLDVESLAFDTGAKMMAPLATGELDVGATAPAAALFNAVAREITIKIVADKGSVPQKDSFQSLLVRQDLIDSGKVKDYANLKGLKVALVFTGVSGHVELDNALKKGGLKLEDVEVVAIPFPDMAVAFANKSIDAAINIEPFVTDAQEKKLAKVFKMSNEFYPNHQQAVVLYSPEFVKNKPDAAKRYMVAYLKAVRYYNDAFVKKDKKAMDEVIDILAKSTAVKNKDLYAKMTMPGLDPDGRVMIDSLKFDQDWYMAKGFQKEKADIDKLVDTSFAKYAVEQLGGAYKK